MSNFDRAVKALKDVDEAIDHLADNDAYVTALQTAGYKPYWEVVG